MKLVEVELDLIGFLRFIVTSNMIGSLNSTSRQKDYWNIARYLISQMTKK